MLGLPGPRFGFIKVVQMQIADPLAMRTYPGLTKYHKSLAQNLPYPMIAVISQERSCMAAMSTACGLQDWKIAERQLCYSETVFLKFSGTQESIPRNRFRQPM